MQERNSLLLSLDPSPVMSAGGYFLFLFLELFFFLPYGSARAEEIAIKQKKNIFCRFFGMVLTGECFIPIVLCSILMRLLPQFLSCYGEATFFCYFSIAGKGEEQAVHVSSNLHDVLPPAYWQCFSHHYTYTFPWISMLYVIHPPPQFFLTCHLPISLPFLQHQPWSGICVSFWKQAVLFPAGCTSLLQLPFCQVFILFFFDSQYADRTVPIYRDKYRSLQGKKRGDEERTLTCRSGTLAKAAVF